MKVETQKKPFNYQVAGSSLTFAPPSCGREANMKAVAASQFWRANSTGKLSLSAYFKYDSGSRIRKCRHSPSSQVSR